MKKIKWLISCVIVAMILTVFSSDVFAAIYLNVSINGNIGYYSKTIAANIWGASQFGASSDYSYTTFSKGSTTTNSSTHLFTLSGEETNYSSISANFGYTELNSRTDTVDIYIFIENIGSRPIIPTISTQIGDETYMTVTVEKVYYTIDVKSDLSTETANTYISTLSSDYSSFLDNMSIDLSNTFMYHLAIELDVPSAVNEFSTSFAINVGFSCDIQYDDELNILSVSQPLNSTSASWSKIGYNRYLSASATKFETNSFTTLVNAYNANGNADIDYGDDQYLNIDGYSGAVVFKDIDVVNIDIATGEIIGKLSDADYDFEWYGGTVTLPAGTVLASGRTLANAESFTVDCYTYYPSFFARRWVIGSTQYISISDETFTGAVEIPAHYTATFNATLYNADKTVATNSYGIIARSYAYDIAYLTSGHNAYLSTNYGYGTYTGYNNSTTQSQMLDWCSNLTKEWKKYATDNPTMAQYTTDVIAGCQGNNWTAYTLNLLYLVKYANNNSQATVGYGNSYTYSLYNTSGVKITSSNGNTITTGGNDSNSRYESEKGAVIGLYGSANASAGEGLTYNSAKMAYGYQYTQNNVKLSPLEFLTYTYTDSDTLETTRVLRDGYVGSDKYTSVFCLGQCDPWGNIWNWIFGSAVIWENSSLYLCVTFDDYDYTANNYYLSSTATTSANLSSGNYNYVQMSYSLPKSSGYYRYTGTSTNLTNPLAQLVGLPTSSSSTASDSTGLCDYFYMSSSSYTFGVLRGGHTTHGAFAGLSCFSVILTFTSTNTYIGFRPLLHIPG